MKKKYLKKMLAIMLSAMTVSATPGFVGAIKEESKKIIQEANSKIENHSLTTDDTAKLLNELEKIAEEGDDDSRKEVAKTLENISSQNLFRGDSIDQILNILKECSKYHNHGRYIAKTIENMANNNVFGNNSLNQVLNILHACSKYGGYDSESVPRAITKMADNGILNDQSIDETLVQILQKCSEHRDSKYATAGAIERLAQLNLLNQCSTDKLKQVIDSLLLCLEDYDFSPKASVFSAIKTMAYKNVLDKCDADQIYKIACASIDYMGDDECLNLDLSDSAINDLANKNMLNKCTDNQIQQIVSLLTEFLENDETQRQATIAICSMNKAGLLNKCSPEKLQQILNLFKIHLKDYLAEVNDENYEMVFQTSQILKTCSEIDALKATVADISNDLAKNQAFYQYLNQDLTFQPLGDILKASTSCSKIQNYQTQTKAVSSVANVLKRLGDEIELNEWSIHQVKANFQNIMEMLAEFSKINSSNQDIVTIINCLSQEEIFNATVGEDFLNEPPLDINKLWTIL